MSFLAIHLLIWVALGLLLAAVVWLWEKARRRKVLRALMPDGPGDTSMVTSASPLRRRVRGFAIAGALGLAALTLLRPTGGSILTHHRLPAKNVILLLDVSRSMGVVDTGNLSRLEAAKLFAREFIAQHPADRIGLLSFAGAAFPECPTTLDRTMLLGRLELQQPGGLPVGGTDLAVALEEASALLTDDPPPGSAIVLLSDGDRLTADIEEISELTTPLREASVPVFTIRTGTPGTARPIPDSDLTSEADHEQLIAIAEATGAASFEGGPDHLDRSLAQLQTHLDTLALDGEDFAPELYSRPLELYAYPLSVLLALLFLRLFLNPRTARRHALVRGILALATSTVVLGGAIPETHAQGPPEAAATEGATDALYAAALLEATGADRPLMLVFTGSDWSDASAAFDTEIREHPVYQEWVARKVVPLTIDLARTGVGAEERRQRRQLASRFAIDSYPTTLFLDVGEDEMGRLNHEPEGPAEWVRRAELILAGDGGASDSAASVERLPERILESLEDPDISDAERAIRHYNQAVEFERLEPDLAQESEDRFDLLEDLLRKAAADAPDERPDVLFAAALKRGTLHHIRGRAALPEAGEGSGDIDPLAPASSAADPEAAIGDFRRALRFYRTAAEAGAGDSELSANLTLVHQDIARAQALIDFQEFYVDTVEKTMETLAQEERFLRSLRRWVTTAAPINRPSIETTSSMIEELLGMAEQVDFPNVQDVSDALDDIRLAPDPHGERDLSSASDSIEDALNHLLQNRQVQQGEGEGELEGEPNEESESDRDGDQDGEEEEPGERPRRRDDAELRRSESEAGDLRERLLDRLGDRGERTNPKEDH